jgi:hypothetical protein
LVRKKSIKNGDHHQIWELIIDESSKSTNPETKTTTLSLKLQQMNIRIRIFKSHLIIAEKSGGIDLNLITDELLDKSKRVNLRAKSDADHPFGPNLTTFLDLLRN